MEKLTKKQFDTKILELIKNIKTKATPFIDDSPKKQRIRIEKANKDIFTFAKTYFPHYIKSDFGKPHKLINQETDKLGQITAIAGFRGLGKTTLLSIIKPIYLALNGLIFFNVKVAKNELKAKSRTIAIRCEFIYNKRLIHDFGQQLKLGPQEENDFTIAQGCRFLAIGYKTGIRGELNNTHRPDYIDIDDLEDHQSFNEKIAKDKLDFVCEEAYGALDRGRGYVIWLGNLTHQKSALNLFYKSTQDKKIQGRKMLIIKADDGKFNPSWKEHFSKDDLMRIYSNMGSFGYERHMRMNPVIEGLKFKEEWFKYFDDSKSLNCSSIVTYCDPSLGSKTTSDYKAIMTVGLYNKRYYLLDCYVKKSTIIEMLEYMYFLHQTFNSTLVMESNFWQKAIWDYIPELSNKYGYILPVVGKENKEKKELRIEKLEPYFNWGWLYFPQTDSEDLRLLIDQLLGFPAFPNDDAPDALAGAVNMLRFNSEPASYESLGKRSVSKLKSII